MTMNEKPIQNLRGKWAKGIVPRNFTWILKDQMAICERLGGYGSSHRPVRRQEEIIWVLNADFDLVVSLIPAAHNLHNYDELKLPYLHRPLADTDEFSVRLPEIYHELRQRLDIGQKLLFHREEVNDILAGFVGGYLAWTGMVPEPPKAVTAAEQLLERQLGPTGREMVRVSSEASPVKNG